MVVVVVEHPYWRARSRYSIQLLRKPIILWNIIIGGAPLVLRPMDNNNSNSRSSCMLLEVRWKRRREFLAIRVALVHQTLNQNEMHNTGGGGGGTDPESDVAGNGGSGIVIYKISRKPAIGTGGTVTQSGGNTIHTFGPNWNIINCVSRVDLYPQELRSILP